MPRPLCVAFMVFSALLVAFSAAALAAEDAPAPTKAPVPSPAALKEAGRVVDGAYKEDLAAARSAEQKRALARKWLKAAKETQDDPVGRYVLLTRAKDTAAEQGGVETALVAADVIGRSYQTDVPALDVDVVGKLAKVIRGPDEAKALALYANGAINEALSTGRFDVARKLAELAASVARGLEDATLAKLTAGRARDVREVEAAEKGTAKAEAALAQGRAPDVAKASLEAGRYRALLIGDWAKGLPLLAAGSDEALRGLAGRDQADPSAAEGKLAVADAWWDAAEKAQGLAKVRMQLRARKGYAEAAKSLGGLAKAKAEQRLKDTETLAAVYGPKKAPDGSGDSGETKLPQGTFLREWTSPTAWAGKPEQCTVKGTKISVVNAGGGNVVYSDLDLVREKDGSLSVTWHRDATHTGYEVWSGPGRDITIRRWNSKADKDAGKPASREGRIVWK